MIDYPHTDATIGRALDTDPAAFDVQVMTHWTGVEWVKVAVHERSLPRWIAECFHREPGPRTGPEA